MQFSQQKASFYVWVLEKRVCFTVISLHKWLAALSTNSDNFIFKELICLNVEGQGRSLLGVCPFLKMTTLKTVCAPITFIKY